jgi:hypothetical protein
MKRWLFPALALLLAGAALVAYLNLRGESDVAMRGIAATADSVARGAYLARIANCAARATPTAVAPRSPAGAPSRRRSGPCTRPT